MLDHCAGAGGQLLTLDHCAGAEGHVLILDHCAGAGGQAAGDDGQGEAGEGAGHHQDGEGQDRGLTQGRNFQHLYSSCRHLEIWSRSVLRVWFTFASIRIRKKENFLPKNFEKYGS